jgi:hypothetical protein
MSDFGLIVRDISHARSTPNSIIYQFANGQRRYLSIPRIASRFMASGFGSSTLMSVSVASSAPLSVLPLAAYLAVSAAWYTMGCSSRYTQLILPGHRCAPLLHLLEGALAPASRRRPEARGCA